MLLHDWVAAKQRERKAELLALREAAAQARGVAPEEEKLASYLAARTADRRPVEGPRLKDLRYANQTVNATRERLDAGRGNVSDDISRSANNSTHRTGAARDLAEELSSDDCMPEESAQIGAAAAMLLRAGNCYEHAVVTTLMHGSPLVSPQTVHLVNAKKRDHVWSELRVDGNGASPGDIVMDAWAEGPAVLREDSEFASNPNAIQSKLGLDAHAAQRAASETKNRFDLIASNDEVRDFVEQALAGYQASDVSLSKKYVWPPTPATSAEFRERSQGRLDALRRANDTGVLEQVILAGAARQLGSNVAQATKMADEWLATNWMTKLGVDAPRREPRGRRRFGTLWGCFLPSRRQSE